MSIAYRDSHGDWRTLRPDFLFFVDTEDGVRASIVDPHGHWLPDAAWKLHGMARFVEVYGERFHRIEAISRVDGKLRVLDFKLAEECARRYSTSRMPDSRTTEQLWRISREHQSGDLGPAPYTEGWRRCHLLLVCERVT